MCHKAGEQDPVIVLSVAVFVEERLLFFGMPDPKRLARFEPIHADQKLDEYVPQADRPE